MSIVLRATILVVDDDESNRVALKKNLEQEAYSVVTANNGLTALEILRNQTIDIVLTDLRMPEMSGLTLLKTIRKLQPNLPVVLITAYGTVDDAVEAMKLGAVDFLAKPMTRAGVMKAVHDCLQRLPRNFIAHQTDLVIGQSVKMVQLKKTIRVVAPTKANVVIQGESGTGKDVVARLLHTESGFTGKLVTINCAAIPETLLESELFGYERGAFTGAVSSKLGLFEVANKGTILLDEFAEMPLSLQTKLLRVLEDGTYFRLGGTEPRKTDARIIAATNADVAERIKCSLFREDLWYRLNVINISIPPLRERGDDILLLAQYYLNKTCEKYNRGKRVFLPEAIQLLQNYNWPGNVRELVNVVERAVVLSTGEVIDCVGLRLPAKLNDTNSIFLQNNEMLQFAIGTSLKEMEDLVIKKTLSALNGDKVLTAKILGINLRTIYRKLQSDL